MMYKKTNNTFTYSPKSDLEIEVGDTKQADFYPQVKIKRWDNDVNFSVRLKTDGIYAPIEDGGIIKSQNLKFYEIETSEAYPEGGYEFDIILDEKPETNKIEFTIQTKGLDFFYQPILKDSELEDGVFRPLHAEGSYAVYRNDGKKGDYSQLGGKNYRCGKAFHIYRPRIEDSGGNTVWGKLNVDVEKGILTVEVPQDFLDKAVYPIKHFAGLLFGYDTAGTAGSVSIKDNIVGSVFTGSAGTGSSISARMIVYYAQDAPKFNLYQHSNLAQVTNGTTDVLNSQESTETWVTLDFTSAPTLTAQDYIICAWSDLYSTYPSSTILKYDSGDTNQGHTQSLSYGTWPNPLVPVHNNNKYSIYVTYTAPVSGVIVNAGCLSVTSSIPSPTVSGGALTTLNCLSVTASIPSPAVTFGSVIDLSCLSVNVIVPSPTIVAGAVISASCLSLSTSIMSPTVGEETIVTLNCLSVTASVNSPTVVTSVNIPMGVGDLTVVVNSASIVGEGVEVNLSSQDIMLTALSPSVTIRTYTAYRVMQIQGDLSGGVFTQNLLLRKITDTEDDS